MIVSRTANTQVNIVAGITILYTQSNASSWLVAVLDKLRQTGLAFVI